MIRRDLKQRGILVHLLLALSAGGAGFGLNLLALPLGWGVHLAFGSVIPLVLFRILPAWYFVASFSFASAATMFIWLHPYAWIVWTFEAIALVALRRKTNPTVSVTLFWLVLGLPLIAFSYGYLMSMPWESAALICVKQFYNAVLCVAVAELLYAAAAYSRRAHRSHQLPRISIIALSVAMATGTVALPAAYFIMWDGASNTIIARERLDRRITAASKAVTDRISEYMHSVMHPLLVHSPTDESPGRVPLIRTTSSNSAVIAAVPDLPVSQERLTADRESWNAISGEYDQCLSACKDSGASATGSPRITGYAITSDAILFYIDKRHAPDTPSMYLAVDWDAFATVIREAADDHGTLYAIVAPRGEILAGGGEEQQQKQVESIAQQARGASSYSQIVPNTSEQEFGDSIMNRLRTGLSYRVSSISDLHGLKLVIARPPSSVVTAIRERQLKLLSAILGLLLATIGVAQLLAGRFAGKIDELTSLLKSHRESRATSPLTSLSTSIVELEDLKRSSLALQESYVDRQEQLDEILQHIEWMLHTIPIVIYVCRVENGRKSSLLYVSGSIDALVGVSPSIAYEPGWWSHSVHPDDFPYAKSALEAIEVGDVRQVEYRIRSADGSYITVEETLTCNFSSVNQDLEAIGLLISKEESASMKKEIQQAAKLASLGEMSAGLAHELNQPLSTISLGCRSLELALKGQNADVDEVKPILGTIRAQTQRAADLVQRLKMFGKPGDEEFSVLNVEDALHAAIKLTAHECARRDIEVSTEIDSGLQTRGSGILLEQCFINFILNAAEAIDEMDAEYGPDSSGHNKSISISATGEQFDIVIEFRDTGPGFKDDALLYACEPFFTSKGPSGTGLGLSVSYSIIHEHRGHVHVGNHSAGAKVVVKLPRELSDDPTAVTRSTRK